MTYEKACKGSLIRIRPSCLIRKVALEVHNMILLLVQDIAFRGSQISARSFVRYLCEKLSLPAPFKQSKAKHFRVLGVKYLINIINHNLLISFSDTAL